MKQGYHLMNGKKIKLKKVKITYKANKGNKC